MRVNIEFPEIHVSTNILILIGCRHEMFLQVFDLMDVVPSCLLIIYQL